MPSFGLVVEGSFDGQIYSTVIRRISPAPDLIIVVRDMGGVSQLIRGFPVMLRDLEQALDGHPVDKALVLRDADGRSAAALEQLLENRIVGQRFVFPRGVEFNVAVQTVEAWLLADPAAINIVALHRQGTELEPAEFPDDPESVPNPKQVLSRLLCAASVPHTAQVCGEIASAMSLEIVRARCGSFRSFERKVSS